MAHSPDILRIPVQLIESACLAGILLVMLLVEKCTCERKYSFYIYIGLYAFCRFIIEFYRGDAIRGIWWGFSTSQWISLFLLFMLAIREVKQTAAKFDRAAGNDK